jgi:hypothetical protein
MASHTRRRGMGARSRQLAEERFDLDKHLADIQALYRRLVDESRKRRSPHLSGEARSE